MSDVDHYSVLLVDPSATTEEIRANYRELVKVFHPDRRGEGSSAAMQKINDAWDVLQNADRRAEYDEFRAAHLRSFDSDIEAEDFEEPWGEESAWEPTKTPQSTPPPPPRQPPPPPTFQHEYQAPPVGGYAAGFTSPGFQAAPGFHPGPSCQGYSPNPTRWPPPQPSVVPPPQTKQRPPRRPRVAYLRGSSPGAIRIGVLWLIVSLGPFLVTLVVDTPGWAFLPWTIGFMALSVVWAHGRIAPGGSSRMFAIWVALSVMFTGVSALAAYTSGAGLGRFYVAVYVGVWTLLYIVAVELRRRDFRRTGE